MTNSNYRKGYNKERNLVNNARDRGLIAFRSAGSHSPIDVCVINTETKRIYLIQCKSDSFPDSERRRLMEKYKDLNGLFTAEYLID